MRLIIILVACSLLPSIKAVALDIETSTEIYTKLISPSTSTYKEAVNFKNGIQKDVINTDQQEDYISPNNANTKVALSNSINDLIINQISHRVYLREPNRTIELTNNSSKTPKTGVVSGDLSGDFNIWMSTSYQNVIEETKESWDFNKISSFSNFIGADVNLPDQATVGLSYGYLRSKIKVYGYQSGIEKEKDKPQTHAIAAYLAKSFRSMHNAFIYIRYNNTHNTTFKKSKIYESGSIADNVVLATSYNTNSDDSPNINLGVMVQICYSKLKTELQKSKYHLNYQPKEYDFTTINVGFNFVTNLLINPAVRIKYKLEIMYKTANISRDMYKNIKGLFATGSYNNISQRPISKNNVTFNATANLVAKKKFIIDINASYTIGQERKAYMATAMLSYIF